MNNFYWWQPKIWWQRPSFKFSTMLLGQVSAPPSTKGLSMLCCRTIWDLQRHILLKVRIALLWRSNLDPQRNYYNILKCDFPVFFCDTILDLQKNIHRLVDCQLFFVGPVWTHKETFITFSMVLLPLYVGQALCQWNITMCLSFSVEPFWTYREIFTFTVKYNFSLWVQSGPTKNFL